jgi:predicted nucleic acid-binding protein
MSHYFFDTSALIKRYVVEQGTSWVRSIVAPKADNTILVAQITRVEIVSGTSRRKRSGQISERTARAVRLMIDRHSSREYKTVGLTEQIIQRAEDLLETHALRAYDAMQLAVALHSNDALVAAGLPPLVFVSADKRLLDAAASEGLSIEDPNTHA